MSALPRLTIDTAQDWDAAQGAMEVALERLGPDHVAGAADVAGLLVAACHALGFAPADLEDPELGELSALALEVLGLPGETSSTLLTSDRQHGLLFP